MGATSGKQIENTPPPDWRSALHKIAAIGGPALAVGGAVLDVFPTPAVRAAVTGLGALVALFAKLDVAFSPKTPGATPTQEK
jgi:hypothetical protein